MDLYNLFRERLGEERANQILQEAVGKTYEELVDENDELSARVEELEKENAQLREELEEAKEFEDPRLRAHKNFSDTITRIVSPKKLIQVRVEREHREGIPMEDINIVEG